RCFLVTGVHTCALPISTCHQCSRRSPGDHSRINDPTEQLATGESPSDQYSWYKYVKQQRSHGDNRWNIGRYPKCEYGRYRKYLRSETRSVGKKCITRCS